MPTWALLILILSLSACAGCAAISWRAASRCAPLRKQTLAHAREIGDLTSEIEALTEAHKRLRSREGMRDLRAARRAAAAPDAAVVPVKETKAQARARIFGATTGPAFARAQLDQVAAAAQHSADGAA